MQEERKEIKAKLINEDSADRALEYPTARWDVPTTFLTEGCSTVKRPLSELQINRITTTKLSTVKRLRELSAGKRGSSAKQT
jgi:hypothetical protein